MGLIVLLNKRGLSLVEMLIAMSILLFVFLALMHVALISIDSNVKNLLRDEAVSIAEQRMTELRNLPFTTSVTNAALNDTNGVSNSVAGNPAEAFVLFDTSKAANVDPNTTSRNLRNVYQMPFIVTKRIDDLNTDNKQIEIKVSWDWKGEPFSHQITGIKRRE